MHNRRSQRIRYIITIVTHPQELPENPLVQRVWKDDIVKLLKSKVQADSIGIIAVMDGDEPSEVLDTKSSISKSP